MLRHGCRSKAWVHCFAVGMSSFSSEAWVCPSTVSCLQIPVSEVRLRAIEYENHIWYGQDDFRSFAFENTFFVSHVLRNNALRCSTLKCSTHIHAVKSSIDQSATVQWSTAFQGNKNNEIGWEVRKYFFVRWCHLVLSNQVLAAKICCDLSLTWRYKMSIPLFMLREKCTTVEK